MIILKLLRRSSLISVGAVTTALILSSCEGGSTPVALAPVSQDAISVAVDPSLTLTDFTLINADTDAPVPGFDLFEAVPDHAPEPG